MRLLRVQQGDAVSPKDWLNSVPDEVAQQAAAVWDQWAAAAIAVVAVLVAGIVAMRAIVGWRARRRRHTVLLKPSSTFDPSPEEVLRFCGQLSRVRSATARVTEPASTQTIRVTLTGAGEGRMAQLLSAPAGAQQILRHRGFAQVELADPATLQSSRASRPGSEGEEAAEPSQSVTTAAAGGDTGAAPVGGAGVDDPLDPDLALRAEDWLDADHGGSLDGPPEEVEWMHPEEQRLAPMPSSPLWECLDEDRS